MKKDLFGRKPEVGDIILYIPYSDKKAFQLGKITGFGKAFGRPTLLINGAKSGGYQSEYVIMQRANGKPYFDNEGRDTKGWCGSSNLLNE